MTTIASDQAISREAMDPAVRPGDDFYAYANGAWLRSTQIPADEAVWGGFTEVRDRNLAILHEILETAAAARGAPGSAEQLIGDLYASGMDEAGIERAGLGSAKTLLEEAGRAPTAGLPAVFAKLHRLAVPAPFWPKLQPDALD